MEHTDSLATTDYSVMRIAGIPNSSPYRAHVETSPFNSVNFFIETSNEQKICHRQYTDPRSLAYSEMLYHWPLALKKNPTKL